MGKKKLLTTISVGTGLSVIIISSLMYLIRGNKKHYFISHN